MLKSRAVESIECEWTKHFVSMNISDGRFWQHEFGDFDRRKVHDGSNDMTFATAEH